MASTFVNDLRLNEMGTGDQSGSWGTVTNTNLELIGEALSFGTEAITTNADTHTTTVADGSTDPGRAMYLKYTGTLDSACTITIGPNTISRMQFIENGTSGSQNIIISQGSGANVTIPPGDTKAVYLDGAGSGAAVVDAFASLSTVDLKVQDDLTVTDDVAIGGLATIGETLGVTGATTLSSTLGVTGAVTANAGVIVDNITIDGTEIDLSSGDLTIDVAGDIILDADGADVKFSDAGTQIGQIEMATASFNIRSMVSDADLLFKGNDGGSTITALTLDMSAGGTAQFSHDIEMVDNGLLRMGAGGDLILTSDGTNGTIFTNNGNLTLDSAGDIVLDADGGDFTFKDGGTTKFQLQNSSDDIQFVNNTQDKDIKFMGDDGGSTITALTLDMSEAGAATFNNNVTAFSDERLKDNIETLEDGLDKVEQLRGVTYTRDDREEIGVIAQEVEKILPEIVLTADDEMGTKSVDYSRITAVLIEAVKELSTRVKELENK